MRRIVRPFLAAAVMLAAVPLQASAAPAPWTCDGDYRALGAVNGPGVYRFRLTSGMSFRYLSEGNGSFSVSSQQGTICTITCLHTNVPALSIRDCVAPEAEHIVVTVAAGDAIAVADDPTGQPGGGVPLPGPLPNDPLFVDPGCDDCSARIVRATETLFPGDLRSTIVVRGEDTGDRYVVTVLVAGEEAFPPISVEDEAALPPFEVSLLPETTAQDLEIVARWHPDAARCPVAAGDPNACNPAGPIRAPREDARWREAGLLIRVVPDGNELYVPYLGQLCAGHGAPNAPDTRPC